MTTVITNQPATNFQRSGLQAETTTEPQPGRLTLAFLVRLADRPTTIKRRLLQMVLLSTNILDDLLR